MDLVSYLTQNPEWENDSPFTSTERIALAAKGLFFQFLFTAGAAFKRQIVIDEQLYEGHFWELLEHIDLNLGPQASYLLETLQESLIHDHPLHLPPPDPQNGEMFFFHALYLRARMDFSLRRFAASLRRVSPLTKACSCPILGEHPLIELGEGTMAKPAISREEARALIQHPLTPFLVGYIVDQWTDFDAPDPHKDPEIQIERIHTRHATLRLIMEEIAQLERLSLLSIFPLFFFRLLRVKYPQKIAPVRDFKQWKFSLRERFIAAHLGFFRLGELLDQIYFRQVIEPGPYGWEHPMEVKAFAGKYGRMWVSGGLQEKIRQLERELLEILE